MSAARGLARRTGPYEPYRRLDVSDSSGNSSPTSLDSSADPMICEINADEAFVASRAR